MSASFEPPSCQTVAKKEFGHIEFDDRCRVVEGAVSGHQGFWGKQPATDYDVHGFSLGGWRFPGGQLVEQELSVLRPVAPMLGDEDRIDAELARFPSFSVQRFSLLLSKDRTKAVFEQALDLDGPDDELNALAQRLRPPKPVVIATQRFGELVLNRDLGWFAGKCDWMGNRIQVHFDQAEAGAIDGPLATAEQLWSDQERWNRQIEEFALQELLPLKNENWLDDGEAPLSPADFRSRMQLDSISVKDEGNFEFWYDDGDLFLGHSIQVRGNLKDGLLRADIPG